MKSKGYYILLALLLAACVSWMSCGDDNPVDSDGNVDNRDFVAEESFYFRVDVVDQTRFRLVGISGSISVTGVAGSDSVIIAGKRRVESESVEDAEEHLELLEVDVQDLASEVVVMTIQPAQTYGRGYEIDYEICVPEDIEVRVVNVNGGVTIDSIKSDITVGNVNGDVIQNGISGSVSVDLVNGSIESEVSLPIDGTIDLEVVNGSIDLEIPQNTSADFSATITNGRIDIVNLTLKDMQTTAVSVTGMLGDGRGTISLSVLNGYMKVEGF
jgi:hypothetical protein